MMDPEKIDAAADLLLGHWRASTRIDAIPANCRPRDRTDGYRIAEALARRSGDLVAGWKIAATSEAGQRHINVDGPLAGRILAKRLIPPGGTVPLGDNIMRVAEAEFAFAFGRALPATGSPYTQAEVMEAVSALHLSIEVPDSRYADFTAVGAPSLIADTACACWLVLGPPITAGWSGIDLAGHRVATFRNGVEAAAGTGKAVLGDPRIALTWLVNEAALYCGGVRAADFVTTGTCVTTVVIKPGDRVTADYGSLGTLSAVIG